MIKAIDIFGPCGVGKTTAYKAVAGMLRDEAGILTAEQFSPPLGNGLSADTEQFYIWCLSKLMHGSKAESRLRLVKMSKERIAGLSELRETKVFYEYLVTGLGLIISYENPKLASEIAFYRMPLPYASIHMTADVDLIVERVRDRARQSKSNMIWWDRDDIVRQNYVAERGAEILRGRGCKVLTVDSGKEDVFETINAFVRRI